MKNLVIYYSYSGKSRKIAQEIARSKNADIVEVKEIKKRSTFNAYVFGSLASRRQKTSEIEKLKCDISAYKKITIVMPIWAGFPAAPFNNIVKVLPSGKEIALVMTSGSGNSNGSADKTKSLITEKGCMVVSYQDIKS